MVGRRLRTRAAGLTYLGAVYAGAIVIGWLVAETAAGVGDWQAVLAADAAATLWVFGAAVAADNTSVYDPYWSVAPLPIALWWAMHGDPHTGRFTVVAVLLALWGVRLTGNFLRGWRGLEHEDWRYAEYRRFGNVRYWLVSLTGLQLVPTLIVFAALLPVLAITRATGSSFGVLDAVAALLAGAALVYETVADEQRRRFAASRKGGFIRSGLWGLSRHPNYLGEVGFWWGMFLFAVAAAWGNWWTIAGPIGITTLFWFVSIPLMERRMRASRPGYAAYAQGIPRLIPRIRRAPVAGGADAHRSADRPGPDGTP